MDKTKNDYGHHSWGNGAYYMEAWGSGALHAGRDEVAEEAFLEALAHDPGSVRAALGMQVLCERQGRGDEASQQVAQHLKRWMIDPGQTHAWVASRLGLTDQPVNRQELEERSLVVSR